MKHLINYSVNIGYNRMWIFKKVLKLLAGEQKTSLKKAFGEKITLKFSQHNVPMVWLLKDGSKSFETQIWLQFIYHI